MYLCHFITSVDSTEPFCFSESRFPFVDISTLFQEGDSILILIPHDNGRSRTAQGETPLLPAVVGPHNIRRQHSLMLWWVLLCDYCSSFVICRRPLNLVGPSMPTSSSLLITVTIAYYSEYVHLQNCLLPSSLPPPRALQLSTSTLPSSFLSELHHTSMGHARLVCTQLYIGSYTSLSRSRYRFLFPPTDRSEGSHSCFPLQPQSQ
jgi:hypothetical protein